MADYIKLNSIIECMTPEQRQYWFWNVNRVGVSESQLEVLAAKVLSGELKESSGSHGEQIEESVLMQDIHKLLNEALEKMNESQRAAYYRTAKHASTIEAKLNMATHLLGKGKKITESRGEKIVRNNGPQGAPDQGAIREAEFRKESDSILNRFLKIETPNALPTAIKESVNPFAQQDYAFAKALGMSESDAVKVATDSLIDRGGPRRMVLKD